MAWQGPADAGQTYTAAHAGAGVVSSSLDLGSPPWCGEGLAEQRIRLCFFHELGCSPCVLLPAWALQYPLFHPQLKCCPCSLLRWAHAVLDVPSTSSWCPGVSPAAVGVLANCWVNYTPKEGASKGIHVDPAFVPTSWSLHSAVLQAL